MSSAYAYPDNPGERERVAAWMREKGLTFPTRPSAEVIRLDNPAKRQPLGLAPADDDKENDGPTNGFQGFHFRDGEHKARPEDALRSDWTFHYFDIIGGVMIELHNDGVREFNDLQDHLKRKFDVIEAARRAETAELKATIAELRGELREMKAIQESVRVASRGERGTEGPRGVRDLPANHGSDLPDLKGLAANPRL